MARLGLGYETLAARNPGHHLLRRGGLRLGRSRCRQGGLRRSHAGRGRHRRLVRRGRRRAALRAGQHLRPRGRPLPRHRHRQRAASSRAHRRRAGDRSADARDDGAVRARRSHGRRRLRAAASVRWDTSGCCRARAGLIRRATATSRSSSTPTSTGARFRRLVGQPDLLDTDPRFRNSGDADAACRGYGHVSGRAPAA